MVTFKIVLLPLSVAVALAAPQPDTPPAYRYNPPPPPTYNQPGMPFAFAYAVKDDYSGNDYAHDQASDGKVTSGSYRVALPDGRIETVTFDADDYSGYVAKVTYEGEATHPAPAPYHPPPPPTPVYG
ncbi:cuticle protein 7-like [Oratosquilla oratoria]|uniref:cuticle protein 7-like n=1 Tax=Oratosquilla oratoria TaxID=337810 RepID=UPI003F75F429